MNKLLILAACLLSLQSCSTVLPFSANSIPAAPDYSKNSSWAALPTTNDPADRTPGPTFEDTQATNEVDVFFLHPTIFYDNRDKEWNADLRNEKLNRKVDESSILYQASAFNAAGRVYAPRYRQAHYRSFLSEDTASAGQALDLAYADIRAAFLYFLEHHNQQRPIIVAAHSQGTVHAKRLLAEFFDGKPLRNRLVAAYLVGWPIRNDEYATLPPCRTPDQTGCICSWRSYRHGHTPKTALLGDGFIATNPLTWRSDGQPADKSLNEGMLARKFEQVLPQRADALAVNGILWVHKPKFPGSALFWRRNYHIADYNLFYVDIRNNARHRVNLFWK